MSSYQCLWCDSFIDQNLKTCPECYYKNPESKRRASRRPRIAVVFSLLTLSLIVSLVFAARLEHSAIASGSSPTVASTRVAAAPVVTFANPVEQATWVNSQKSLSQLFGQKSYTAFMSTGAGNVVSLCGSVHGTSGYHSRSGRQRYVSVFGRLDGTVIETQDPSFQVLWTRVCIGSGTV